MFKVSSLPSPGSTNSGRAGVELTFKVGLGVATLRVTPGEFDSPATKYFWPLDSLSIFCSLGRLSYAGIGGGFISCVSHA